MNPEALTQLLAIVRDMIELHGKRQAAILISDAHHGRPRQPINPANMHLFRQYRNHVSADPKVMIAAAAE